MHLDIIWDMLALILRGFSNLSGRLIYQKGSIYSLPSNEVIINGNF